jgi:hypothetical protein
MSGKNKIGRRLERLVAAMLKEAGWTVRIVEPSIKYLARQKTYISRPQDIFGADIVCLYAGSFLALLISIPLGILLAFAYLGRIVIRLCEALRW